METIGNLMMLAGLRVEHENSAFYIKILYDSTAKNLRSTAKNLNQIFKSLSTARDVWFNCAQWMTRI